MDSRMEEMEAMNIPDWWLIVTGVFFAVSLLLNVGLIVGGLIAWKKIGPLLEETRRQVHEVGGRTSHIAASAQDTVDLVKQKTTRILGSAEEASAEVARRAAVVGGAMTALFVGTRIVGALRGLGRAPMSRNGADRPLPEHTKA